MFAIAAERPFAVQAETDSRDRLHAAEAAGQQFKEGYLSLTDNQVIDSRKIVQEGYPDRAGVGAAEHHPDLRRQLFEAERYLVSFQK